VGGGEILDLPRFVRWFLFPSARGVVAVAKNRTVHNWKVHSVQRDAAFYCSNR